LPSQISSEIACFLANVTMPSSTFLRHSFLPDYTISMFEFDFRQGQSQTTPDGISFSRFRLMTHGMAMLAILLDGKV
jgi:hypothetical protein